MILSIKKHSILLLFIINIFVCCKKETDKNVKIFYYPHSNDIEAHAEVKDKRLHGKYIEYFQNKKVRKESIYVSGKREGKSVTYDEQGRVTLIEFFKNHLQDSVKMFFKENGDIYKFEKYKEGKKNGQFVTRFDNGNIYQDFNYYEGKTNGSQKIFYENGKLKSAVYYKNGNPGKGTIEFDKDGRKLDYDVKILVEEKNKVALEGIYYYKFRLNKPSKGDKFFICDLDSNKYLPIGRFELKEEKGYFTHPLYIEYNSLFINSFNVIAVTHTASGKELVLSKKINVAVSNY